MSSVVFALLLSIQIVGGDFTHTTVRGESLTSIAARYGVEARVIAETNGLRPSAVLKPGLILQINNRHIVPNVAGDALVVNIPQRMIFSFVGGDVRGYPIAAGKASWRTPTGTFSVARLERNPTWDVPLSIQAEMRAQGKPVLTHVPPSPANPLGQYWIGTDLPGIGIHGTNAPSSIFSLKTHGCVRVHPDNIGELFGRVQVGDRGQIVYSPVLMVRSGDNVYVEIHADTYRAARNPAEVVREMASTLGVADMLDWSAVNEAIQKHEGIARPVNLVR